MIPYLKVQLAGVLQAFQHLFSKDGWIVKTLLAGWMFLAGIHNYIFIILTLSIIDVLTGLAASLKRGEGFSSRKFRKGLLEKFALFLVMLVSVFMLDTVLHSIAKFDTFFLSTIVTLMICLYECSSIFENIYSINPKIPFISGLVNVFNKLSSKTMDSLDQKADVIVDAVTELKINGSDKPSTDGK